MYKELNTLSSCASNVLSLYSQQSSKSLFRALCNFGKSDFERRKKIKQVIIIWFGWVIYSYTSLINNYHLLNSQLSECSCTNQYFNELNYKSKL